MLKVVKVRKGHGHGFKKKLVVEDYIPSVAEENKIEIVKVDEPLKQIFDDILKENLETSERFYIDTPEPSQEVLVPSKK